MAKNAIESEFLTSNMADLSEMTRNSIESDFRTSKMAAEKNNKILYRSEMLSKVIFEHPKCKKFQQKIKFRIDLKWPEMRSKVNFGHPKWPTAAILSKITKENKVVYRSEMARNAIKSEFRTSKMGAGGHFVKKIQIPY